jgi:serine/threonine-protein phosphatase 2B catalytic subunit
MEPLSDPCNDRFVKDVNPPPHKPISMELLYPNKGKGLHKLKDLRKASQIGKF